MPHPQMVVNTMWALDDFTEENGPRAWCPGATRGSTAARTRRRRP
ncbi:MAG: phytanoyl-CoA dioxygenase family protein [Chloroflexi bacterium]|nr:phytanoyl-CoA dioxygenase family protein [Chloroflexota bacterium]